MPAAGHGLARADGHPLSRILPGFASSARHSMRCSASKPCVHWPAGTRRWKSCLAESQSECVRRRAEARGRGAVRRLPAVSVPSVIAEEPASLAIWRAYAGGLPGGSLHDSNRLPPGTRRQPPRSRSASASSRSGPQADSMKA
jgi:hypothetical protein